MKLQQLAYFVETYKYQNMSIASRNHDTAPRGEAVDL